MDRRHRPGQHVVQAEPLRLARREDHLARGDSHPHGRAGCERRVGGEQRAAVEGQLEQPAAGVAAATTRASNTLPSPTASRSHGRSGRLISVVTGAAGHAAAALEQQHVRRQPHHVVEIVRDEDQRDVERAAQRVDLVLQTVAARGDRRRRTARRAAAPPARAPARARARRADARRPTARAGGESRCSDRCTDASSCLARERAVRRAGDARAPS